MTKKSSARLQRDAAAHQGEQPVKSDHYSIILNSEVLPDSLKKFILRVVQEKQVVISLFPRVGHYSASLMPLEFGVAILFTGTPHGQIKYTTIENFDRAEEVRDSEELGGGIVEEDQLADLWASVHAAAWSRDVED